jgi:hypothetical protein
MAAGTAWHLIFSCFLPIKVPIGFGQICNTYFYFDLIADTGQIHEILKGFDLRIEFAVSSFLPYFRNRWKNFHLTLLFCNISLLGR